MERCSILLWRLKLSEAKQTVSRHNGRYDDSRCAEVAMSM